MEELNSLSGPLPQELKGQQGRMLAGSQPRDNAWSSSWQG